MPLQEKECAARPGRYVVESFKSPSIANSVIEISPDTSVVVVFPFPFHFETIPNKTPTDLLTFGALPPLPPQGLLLCDLER